MAFQLDQFLTELDGNPSLEVVNGLKKSDLITVGKHYHLDVKQTLRKDEIKRIIIQHLVDEDMMSEDVLNQIPLIPGSDVELKKMELEIKKIEHTREIKKMELEHTRLQIDLEAKRIEAEKVVAMKKDQYQSEHFDISKQINLVPPFQEKSVDKYFQQFEKMAIRLKWPTEYWTTLLQSVLTGKAQEVFSILSVEQSYDFQHVKRCILNAYELVPEAYRLKFREYKKFDNQTYVEFAREKEALFDRWCSSKDIREDYSRLRELMLIEEFKSCIPVELKTYLDDQKAFKLHNAAVLADEYSLTHKNVATRNKQYQDDFTVKSDSQTKGDSHSKATSQSQNLPSTKICAYCKKVGHLISECYRLKNKNSPNSLISHSSNSSRSNQSFDQIQSTVEPKVNTLDTSEDVINEVKEDVYGDKFKPFITEGFVSFVGDSHLQPIKILRDTGAIQSLILEGILPFSEKSSVGANVLISGVEGGTISVPLHKTHLQSNLVTGVVTLGVISSLPVEGISMLLGNDLAGWKVIPEVHVVETPVSNPSTEQLTEEFPNIFPACAVTRSQKRFRKSDEDFSLSDTFISHADEISDSTASSSNDSESFFTSLHRNNLIKEQEDDPETCLLFQDALDENEAGKVPVCYYKKSGVLMRKWRAPEVSADEDWNIIHQIVVPKCYRNDILNLAHDHLTALLKKDMKFSWTQNCRISFERIKTMLTNEPILKAPDFDKPFKLAVDASDVGAGAVLLQEQNNVDHPVCYFSRKFDRHQQNYSTIEKESLALLLALQHFDVYLCSSPFVINVYTDHNPLVFVNKMKNNNQRLLRWSIILQQYNVSINHIRGSENVIADALSRHS